MPAAIEKPAPWTVDRADIDTDYQSIFDKILHGWPIWEGTGTSLEDVIGTNDFAFPGSLLPAWADDADYGWVLDCAGGSTNQVASGSSVTPPTTGCVVLLLNKDNNPVMDRIFGFHDGFEMRWQGDITTAWHEFWKGGTSVTSTAAATLAAWHLFIFNWDSSGNSELWLDGSLVDTDTTHTTDPGSGTIALNGRTGATPNFLGLIGMAILLDEELTSGEIALLETDPWGWCREVAAPAQNLSGALFTPTPTFPTAAITVDLADEALPLFAQMIGA